MHIILTVDHLQDAPLARKLLGELITPRNHVARESPVRLRLIGLRLATRRVKVVTTRVFGVYGTRTAIVFGPGERVHVEAPLSDGAVLAGARQILGIADEKLQVTLNVDRSMHVFDRWRHGFVQMADTAKRKFATTVAPRNTV